jgi:hypothetical protein
MKYNLESMLPEKAFSPRGGRGPFSLGMTLEGGGGGPSGPATSTTVTSNIPEYAEPYVTNMLDLTQKELFKFNPKGEITGFEPYTPYSTNVQDYFAGFSPLQRQAQIEAGAMQQPGQFALGSGLAGSAGIRSLGAAGQYAQDVTNRQRVDASGKPMFDRNGNPMFDASNKTQSFMSPYQQAVTDAAKSSAVRESQMAQQAQNLGAARTGTYGGARQLLANTERERNLLTNLTNIETQGNQAAYDRAMQTQQFGANLGMQGYGQALGAGAQLGQIGATQQATDIARQNQMATMGGQQQALEQNRINQAIQDYSTQQQYPLMQLGFMSNMLRGLPMEGLSRQTYAPQPSFLTQGVGTVGALGSLANVFRGREGGLPEEFESTTGIKSYNVGGSVGGSVESKLQDMSPAELQNYIKETSSPMARQIAEKVLRDKVGRAGGGIIAFSNRGKVEDEDKEDQEKVRQAYIDAAKLKQNEIPESLRYNQEKMDTQKQLIADVGSQLNRTPAPASTRGAGGQGITENVLKQIAARDFSGIAGVRSDTEPKAEPKVEPKAEPKAGTKSAEARAETTAPRKETTPAAPATTGGGTGIKAVPSDKIMPTAGLTIPDTDSIDVSKIREKALAEKEAYMGPNIAAQQDRARLMAERVNAKEEARRASSMRMAEFFAAWGSTPGSTIVAGLNTLRNKIPDFINDEKEEARIRKAIDKDIVELEKIDRLEKSSNYDAATNTAQKLKSELSKNALQKYGYDIKALSDANQTAAYREAAKNRGAGSGGEDKGLTNLFNTRVNIEKAITAAKDKLRTGVKLKAAQPDSTDPKEQEKILAARAEVAKATGSLESQLKQINSVIDTYKKVQGAEASTSGNDPLNIRKP